jgi:hypothetical protein
MPLSSSRRVISGKHCIALTDISSMGVMRIRRREKQLLKLVIPKLLLQPLSREHSVLSFISISDFNMPSSEAKDNKMAKGKNLKPRKQVFSLIESIHEPEAAYRSSDSPSYKHKFEVLSIHGDLRIRTHSPFIDSTGAVRSYRRKIPTLRKLSDPCTP